MISLLNELPESVACTELLRCCGSPRWVDKMVEARPFASVLHLKAVADRTWWSLPYSEYYTAFQAHPRIGGDVAALRQKFASTTSSSNGGGAHHGGSWEEGEQSGTKSASEEVLRALAQGNDDYDAKFGHVFLICATGKSASEMLNALEQRISNSAEAEVLIAAGEQAKITYLRIDKLLVSLQENKAKATSSRL